MAALLARFEERGKELAGWTPGPIHRDFSPEHLVVHGDQFTGLDFDEFCQYDPLFDVAQFSAHLAFPGLTHFGTLDHFDTLAERFLAAYQACGGDYSQARLGLYKAIAYFKLGRKVEARGDEFKCYYDGQLRIAAKDDTLLDAGKIGLWTKADSVIYFDDLTVQDLGSPGSLSAASKTFAQELVDDLVARCSELVRVGLHVTLPSGGHNVIIASNVREKIGRPSDPEDLKAMQAGQP
ncbi:MAG TPA: phosphotransferase, partial [Candidatus Acidoferrales bacterium]|nr:phosphotransferase [Candidatus Acidoferrales bacterium]